MQKGLFVFFVGVLLLSCNSRIAVPSEQAALQYRIDQLETRIDSLVKSFSFRAEQTATAKIKKSKKPAVASEEYKAAPQPIPATASTPVQRQSSASSYSYSGQCMATTKKGTRCKRSSRSGGYCWQHGG